MVDRDRGLGSCTDPGSRMQEPAARWTGCAAKRSADRHRYSGKNSGRISTGRPEHSGECVERCGDPERNSHRRRIACLAGNDSGTVHGVRTVVNNLTVQPAQRASAAPAPVHQEPTPRESRKKERNAIADNRNKASAPPPPQPAPQPVRSAPPVSAAQPQAPAPAPPPPPRPVVQQFT